MSFSLTVTVCLLCVRFAFLSNSIVLFIIFKGFFCAADMLLCILMFSMFLCYIEYSVIL